MLCIHMYVCYVCLCVRAGLSEPKLRQCSGVYSREYEKFIPSAAYSLNRAGCFAAEKACNKATLYFPFMQGFYSFLVIYS